MKTLAIRLEDDVHAQLSVIAQLAETTVTDEIRAALEAHVTARRADPALSQRADAAREEIEREAAARQAALSELFSGKAADGAPGTATATAGRGRAKS